MPELFQDPVHLLSVLLIGLVAGFLGGLLGVGGSIIMIPGLTFVLGFQQHLYQAAAMIANVAVSIPAAIRHHRAGAMVPVALRSMLPSALLFVVLGVWVSNRPVFVGSDGGLWLGRLLAAFLIYVVCVNARWLRRDALGESSGQAILTPWRCSGVAAGMGFIAGLLGIGGGALAVPLQQIVLRLPLRSCIANSAAVICVSATVGAVYKCGTLGVHQHRWTEAVLIGALLIPTAWIGGTLGASLTHRLPIRQLRLAFIVLMLVAAIKMAAIPWRQDDSQPVEFP